jgi:hypothetical protein
MVALRWLRERAWPEVPVVVAVGQQAVVGEFLALGGRACGLVLVDTTPVLDVDPDESQRLVYEWMRARAENGGNPRVLHRLPPQTDAAWSARQRAAIAVPVLELEGTGESEVVAETRAWWDAVRDSRYR